MSLFAAYQTLWLPGVLRAGLTFNGGVRDWAVQKNWAPDTRVTAKRAVLAVYDAVELVDALVNDFVVLSTVAFESAVSVRQRADEPRGCAWQLISYYYSAYFSANAIMRLGGYLCANIDPPTCTEINERALLYGLGGEDNKSKLAPAVFYGVYSVPHSRLVLQNLSGVKGGVHIQFWAGFLRFLEAIEKEIDSTPLAAADRTRALSELHQLKKTLTLSGRQNGAWMSDVRNAVNYRFENGVWFPYSGSTVTGDQLEASLRGGLRGSMPLAAPSGAMSDCSRLVSVSAFLLRWLDTSLKTIEGKAHKSKKKSIQQGAMAFSQQV